MPPANAKWTVMVLMGANKVDDEADLSEPRADNHNLSIAESDLLEMEYATRSDEKSVLNIVVQIDQKLDQATGLGGPQRYVIRKGKRQLLPRPPDLGSGPGVLEDFVSWAKDKYEARRYLLVLWGHAYRLAFNRAPQDPAGLDFPELADVLTNVQQDGKKLDIVAFDSCNVSLIEAAYQLRGVANYMVASQFSDPLPGFPYDKILTKVLKDPDCLAGDDQEDDQGIYHGGPKDFGRAIVSQFVRNYVGDKSATMTMLDLGSIGEIREGVAVLARELLLTIDADESELELVKDVFERSQVPIDQPSVDLATFCWHLQNFSRTRRVQVAASVLGDLLLRPTTPFVVAHGRSDLLVAMLQGVSAFAPNVVSQSGFVDQTLRDEYDLLDLAHDTLWGKLVFALAEPDV
jgi:hypothetical protein